MHTKISGKAAIGVALALAITATAAGVTRADLITFNSQPAWQAAVGGPGNTTVFHFDGPTELHGRFANDPNIIPSYSSQGVNFLPFTGTSVFPVIFRNQGFQIPDPNRDGLLANNSSPNPVTDLDGRAIKFNFNFETNAVGVFTNRFPLIDPVGDGGFMQVFDSSLNLIGQVDLQPGVFGGVIADRPIGHVAIVNTFDSDIQFGIWDLQFSRGVVAVPEPSTLLLCGIGSVGLLGYGWRRQRERAKPVAP